MVYVLSKSGQPLMPTKKHGKVRHMLNSGKAKVVKRTPFTIQLTYETDSYTQDINVGVLPGYEEIRISAATEKEELYSGVTELRTNIPTLLEKRREARRTRRNRLRYRHARFDNRIRTKKKGWMAPSVTQKVDSQINAIQKVASILPVNKVYIEVAKFDIQKIINPDISGEEYQQGYDEWNVREYVLARDKHTCRYCKGKSGDDILGIHHLKNYLPDRKAHYSPSNSVTTCRTCHDKINAGEEMPKLRKAGDFRAEAFLNTTRYCLAAKARDLFPEKTFVTFGYVIKNTRINAGLPSTKENYVLCITNNPNATPSEEFFAARKLRCHNRQIYKSNPMKGGIYKKCQSPKYLNGIKLWDKVLYNGQVGFISSRNRLGSCGYVKIKTFDGEMIKSSARIDQVKVLEHAGSLIIERKKKG